MNLSIIVPVGRPDTAQQTVESILGQTVLPQDIQIVLVGAGLNALQSLAQDDRIIYVHLDKRLKPAETRMAGIEKATGEWLLFVDDDIELEPHFIEELLALLKSETNLGAVGARLPGREQTYFSRVTDLANFWSQQGSISGRREWLYSAVLAVPAAVYLEAGGFNPELAIGEDIDLTRRIGAAGYRVLYCADLVAYHNHRRTRLSLTASYFWHNGGLARYQVQRDGQLRVFNLGRVLAVLAASLRNSWNFNRREVKHFFLYLPGVALMYLIYSFSLEYHNQVYTSDFIRKHVDSEELSTMNVPNILYRKSIAAQTNDNSFLAMFWYTASLLLENSTTVILLLLLVVLVWMI